MLTSPEQALLLIAAMVVLAAVIPFSFALYQRRRQRAGKSRLAETGWEISGLSDLQTRGFTLFRIAPTDSWTKAEFIFQKEDQSELGRFASASTVRGKITYGGKTMEQYVQRYSKFAGKVGGKSNRSIVYRVSDAVAAEMLPVRSFPSRHMRLRWRGSDYVVQEKAWTFFKTGEVFQDTRLIGRYAAARSISQEIFFAMQPDLDPELKVILCSAALLK